MGVVNDIVNQDQSAVWIAEPYGFSRSAPTQQAK